MMRNRLNAAIAASTLALAAWSGLGQPAHAAALNSTCTQGEDPTCNPGSGWTEVFITHAGSGGFVWAIQDLGDSLDQAYENQSCQRQNSMYWWYRSINGGAQAQFVQDGNDGNFHALGFSGGEFKLQSGVGTIGLWFWDQSGGNWSYASDSIGSYFMTSPDAGSTYIEATISVQSHWAVSYAPFPTGNHCNTHSPA